MAANNSNQNQAQTPEPPRSPQCPICSGFSRPWRWAIIAGLVLLILAIFINRSRTINEPDTPAVIWGHDYQSALEQAKTQNKPLLLAFHASWCPPCIKMKRTTYHNPQVIEISLSFIPVMIDEDKQSNLFALYNVQYLPTYIIARPDGTTIESFSGYYPPADFTAKLKTALP